MPKNKVYSLYLNIEIMSFIEKYAELKTTDIWKVSRNSIVNKALEDFVEKVKLEGKWEQ